MLFSHYCGIVCSFSKAHVRSNFWLDLHCLYAHLEVVRFTAMGSARPLYADAAKLCANWREVRSLDINLPPIFMFVRTSLSADQLFNRCEMTIGAQISSKDRRN